MNKLIIMMNLCTPMRHFGGGGKKYAMHGKTGFYIAYLIKTCGNSLHWVHRFINYMIKVINILNYYQLIDNNDVPVYPYEHTGAYGNFLQGVKRGVFGMVKNGQKEAFLESRSTSRYIGTSTSPEEIASGWKEHPALATTNNIGREESI